MLFHIGIVLFIVGAIVTIGTFVHWLIYRD
jgi:hypothetical protein